MWYVINKNLLLLKDEKEIKSVPLFSGSDQSIIRCCACKDDFFRGFIKYSKDEILKARSEKTKLPERYSGDPRGQM
jgi:hypothetical protein